LNRFLDRVIVTPGGLLALIVVLLLAIATSPAWAAETIAIPAGDWLAVVAEWAGPILGALVLWGVRQLPGEVVAFLRVIRFEQLVDRSIDAAVQATAGAARGRTLSVDIGSKVLAEATKIVIASAPKLVRWAAGGDEDLLRRKILARLDLEPGAEYAAITDRGPQLIRGRSAPAAAILLFAAAFVFGGGGSARADAPCISFDLAQAGFEAAGLTLISLHGAELTRAGELYNAFPPASSVLIGSAAYADRPDGGGILVVGPGLALCLGMNLTLPPRDWSAFMRSVRGPGA
jgi:hypothetical protein